MPMLDKTESMRYNQVSPLVIADRLLSLAQDADRAGFTRPAERLLRMAYAVCDEKPN